VILALSAALVGCSSSGSTVKTIAGCKIEPSTNCAGSNLSGQDLQGANLSEANLSNANLSGANLSKANLSGANLTSANLSRATLDGSNLTSANLTKTDLRGASLTNDLLTNAIRCGTIRTDGTIDDTGCATTGQATTTAAASTPSSAATPTSTAVALPCASAALLTAAEHYSGTALFPPVGATLTADGPARCDTDWASMSVRGGSGNPVLFVYKAVGGVWVALSYGSKGELCGGNHENVDIPSAIAAKIEC
jgi:uncharacterized protein YjbI with pentapeptide repeats